MKDHISKTLRSFRVLPALYLILIVFSISLASGALAEVYKTTDEDGNVIYTDRAPDADAKPMVLKGLSVISPQLPSNADTELTESVGAEGDPDDAVTNIRKLKKGYQDFSIVSPTPEQTFWGTDNTVTVAWNTRFALQPGMKVRIIVNGEIRQESANSMINLDEIWRGTHEVYAELIDGRNRKIATTQPVSFHMKQYSTQFNARRNQGG
jgi:hypothetical protein